MQSSKIRTRRITKVSPYNGFKFKESPSSSIFYATKNSTKAVYLPEYDNPSYHNVLTNMRNSVSYVKDPSSFEDKFMRHLEKTGFDELGMVCRKEYLNNVEKQRKNLGVRKIW